MRIYYVLLLSSWLNYVELMVRFWFVIVAVCGQLMVD